MVIDHPLTIGPEPDSKFVRFARGMYKEVGLLVTLNFVCSVRASTVEALLISVLGHNPMFHEHRKLPISGNSDVFWLVEESPLPRLTSLMPPDAIVEHHLSIVHYL